MSAQPQSSRGIDPRGPRVTAGVTGIVVLLVVALGLLGLTPAATILLTAQAVVFLVAAIVGAARHPYGFVYKRLIRPRLQPPTELEDPAPPTFSQGVGFAVVTLGIVLQLVGVPYAVVVAAAAAFVVAFLNSVFGYCVGCQIYLLLARAGIIRRKPAPAA
ncbi:MAG TPA: DUF4395 domain-containing protein [Pseudolysinimonas sp.]|jgi:predicted neutral ceramidase superfamily lipid hydrolase|nr:DUF4395 domain-containing protein [Pseudolysinimonas sp.]